MVRRLCFLGLFPFLLVACGDDDSEFSTDTGDASVDTSDQDVNGQDTGGRDTGGRDVSLPDTNLPDTVGECGDGALGGEEACDDGNTDDGDGCSASCQVEENFACPRPGSPCVQVVTCGNGRIEGAETCDDGNTTAGDGCSDMCEVESGWTCPVVGAACVSAGCGDGILAGFEVCDDGNTNDGDGCSASCEYEDGYTCDGTMCRETTCGDGVVEGTEDCDDGNLLIGDGCTPLCTREPECMNGTCTAVCGDGVVFAPETCDDANRFNGDGCDSNCQIETGYTCTEVPEAPPSEVQVPVVIRDFIPACYPGTRPQFGEPGAAAPYGHPDFECYTDPLDGMVETTLTDGRPVYVENNQVTDAASFDLWYRSDNDYNRTVPQVMTLTETAPGSGDYQFDDTTFFPLSHPIDGSAPAGFPTEGNEPLHEGRNFGFTSEVRYWFEYEGDEVLTFSGDDDVWVFINGRLAVDLGGPHPRLTDSITLSECDDANPANNNASCLMPLDLTIGGIYEAVVFQAERHTSASQYQLTLSNFGRAPSSCQSTCGDGVVASNEACDDGESNGAAYDGCTSECTLSPYCGDGVVQSEHGEVCDDGFNLGGNASECAPGCQEFGARCGDGVVQTDAGEECDDGNTMSGDGCSDMCRVELI